MVRLFLLSSHVFTTENPQTRQQPPLAQRLTRTAVPL